MVSTIAAAKSQKRALGAIELKPSKNDWEFINL